MAEVPIRWFTLYPRCQPETEGEAIRLGWWLYECEEILLEHLRKNRTRDEG